MALQAAGRTWPSNLSEMRRVSSTVTRCDLGFKTMPTCLWLKNSL